jgi:hypothetical protein
MKTLRYVVPVVAVAAMAIGGMLASAGDQKPKADWKPVFNGKDLEGWKAQGSAIFKVEDGCLLGTQTDGKGGDIFTTAEWDNFELRFTYKVGWPANSGVWFRTNYQYDILKWKNPVAFSGTLYCSGKMFITTNLNEAQENRDGWNEAQVYANGDHLVLWLNGKKVGECHDKTYAKGKIGIQVHGGNDFKGMKILIKRMEIRTLAAGEGPIAPPTTAPATAPSTAPAAAPPGK